jgi:hypothetical protein
MNTCRSEDARPAAAGRLLGELLTPSFVISSVSLAACRKGDPLGGEGEPVQALRVGSHATSRGGLSHSRSRYGFASGPDPSPRFVRLPYRSTTLEVLTTPC